MTEKIIFKTTIIFLLTGLYIGVVTPVCSQSLAQNVVGNAGVFHSTGLGNLHWTIGEVVIERFENEIELAQGFHQLYYDFIITSDESHEVNNRLSVFPNPTSGELRLEMEWDGLAVIKLTNAQGALCQQSNIYSKTTNLDLLKYPGGMYFLTIFKDGKLQKTFKIIKL